MDTAIELSHVRKAFGRFTAVDDLSLSVPRGAMFGLLGPHRAGKPTTKVIEEVADMWTFLVKTLDFKPTIPK